MGDELVGPKAPKHLWLVGGFALVFNGIGLYDYVLTWAQDQAYFELLRYDAAQIAYFANYPVLPAIFWTVSVFGAVAASVLLLFRSRYTVPVALVALCAQAGLDIISFGFMDRLGVRGIRQSLFDILVPLGLAALLYWYAVVMSRRGVLR
ncbi:MAG: hypothetical protein Q7W30_04480 [Coriobacteriia bacterium]|nr:hypothetical protein [Coriobacteriia bacterium]